MRTRTSLLFALLLPVSSACAMADAPARLIAPSFGPRLSLAADTTLTAHKSAQLDTLTAAYPLAQSVDSAVTRLCATKNPPGYMRAVCAYPKVILRLIGHAARAETLYVAPVDSTPVVVLPPPDTTTVPDTSTGSTTTPGAPPGTIFTHPFAPPANGAILAELPRDTVNVGYPAVTRVVRTANLQAALDSAKAGDEIRVPVGTVLRNIVVRRSNVTVRTDVDLGGVWDRMTASKASSLNLATITSSTTDVPLTVASGVQNVRIDGFRITTTAPSSGTMVRVGLGETDPALLPTNIVLAHLAADAGSNDVRRCVVLDGAKQALVSSTLANCHSNLGDAQGVLSINGKGPLRIENNAIAGSHQFVMFGGGDPVIVGQVPSDAVIRRNDFTRPLAWKGVWQAKTGLEFKIGKRLLIEGNVVAHTWVDAQDAFAFLGKSVNQDGACSWCETSDVTIRYNQFTGAAGVFNVVPNPQGVVVPAARFTIYNNAADSISVGPYAGSVDGLLEQGVSDVVFLNNWIRNPGGRSAMYFVSSSARFVAQGNVFGGQYGIKYDGAWGTNPGASTPNAIISNNVLVPWGTSFSAWPAQPSDAVRSALLQGVVVP